MNVNGDGRNVWPWIDPWVRDRFDCSKLDDWEIVFSQVTRLGIQQPVVTQETENETSRDWVAVARRLPETGPATMLFPADEWLDASPEEVGVDPNGLHHALNYWRMHSGTNGVEEVVMVRRGVVFYRGAEAGRAHNVWSVTKSFTSTALGLLVADAAVSLETRAMDLEPVLRELYPDVTLRDFTTMTSGYDAAGRSRWGAASQDWSPTPYTAGPPLFAPGTKFAYWDEAQMMFGRLLTRAAKRDLLEFLGERVFSQIGRIDA
jgi:CubicO group peptidase (beta-lactamase class C family)